MKVYMDYETYKRYSLYLADKIKEDGCDTLVAITRGGISAGHIIAKELGMPLYYYFPNYDQIFPYPPNAKKMAFIEDLIAQGRTLQNVKDYFDRQWFPINWHFYTILQDAYFENDTKVTYTVKTKDWIVFPYESYNAVIENDRGLFREGTGQYGK